MTRYLDVSVTFLDPLFHGKRDAEEPEWPPSPMRLFQALLAGSRTGCRSREWSKAKAEAFHWLEQREPPMIIAPDARRAPAYTLFVPNNDSDKNFERESRLTSKIVQPHRLRDGDTVHYLWPIDETDFAAAKPHAELLCREARNILALGWGIDQVVGDGRILTDAEVDKLPGQRWRAWNIHRPEQDIWRIPKSGTLEDLERVHALFLARVQEKKYRALPRKFGTVTYIRQTILSPRPYAVFELSEDDPPFRGVDVVKVAAMLRSLTCRIAKGDTHQFPGGAERYVAGHISDESFCPPRFSYLPLPTIGHPYADGMIRRLMIAEPFGGDGKHAEWAQRRLRGEVLISQEGKKEGRLLPLWKSTSKNIIRRYVRESRKWHSVTPVILPGYDNFKAIPHHAKQQPTKAERLLFKCFAQAGIPLESIESVTMRKAPFWRGSQHPREYYRPDYLADHRARPGWHVSIVFRDAVSGPLAIGAGRHCGLGIFAAADE